MRRAVAAVPETDWQGPARRGVLPVGKVTLRLTDWSCSRRVVVGWPCLGHISQEAGGIFWDEVQHEFEACMTSLLVTQACAWPVIELYRQRADTENVLDELKHPWGLGGFSGLRRGWCKAGGKSAAMLGFGNNYSAASAIIDGGYNTSSGHFASVLGGTGNTASGYYSVVSGGYNNQALGNWSTIGGGANAIAATELAHVP